MIKFTNNFGRYTDKPLGSKIIQRRKVSPVIQVTTPVGYDLHFFISFDRSFKAQCMDTFGNRVSCHFEYSSYTAVAIFPAISKSFALSEPLTELLFPLCDLKLETILPAIYFRSN